MPIFPLYVSREDLKVFKKFKRLVGRGNVSPVIMAMIKRYVKGKQK